jgi:hypothetical protein
VSSSPNTKRNVDKSSNDLYNTPTDALEAAWEDGVFHKFDVYWDPCNGLGKISDFLESKGKKVYRSDIEDYGNADFVIDFLECKSLPEGVECIVHNPPFKLTEQFVDHSLMLCDDLIMFNRATVLETKSRSEKHANREWPLRDFWSFGNRVSCTEGVEEKPTANSVWYGFFHYDLNYWMEPNIKWLFTK